MAHLSKEASVKIVEDFLEVFTMFCDDIHAFHLSFPIVGDEDSFEEAEKLEKFVVYIWDCNQKSQLTKNTYLVASKEDVFLHNTYLLLYNGRRYEMNIYNSCEACGYYSTAKSEEEEERRLLCYIRELRENDEIKNQINFEFDIVDMVLLDIFDICFTNTKQYHRKCNVVEEVTSEFVGRKLRNVD